MKPLREYTPSPHQNRAADMLPFWLAMHRRAHSPKPQSLWQRVKSALSRNANRHAK